MAFLILKFVVFLIVLLRASQDCGSISTPSGPFPLISSFICYGTTLQHVASCQRTRIACVNTVSLEGWPFFWRQSVKFIPHLLLLSFVYDEALLVRYGRPSNITGTFGGQEVCFFGTFFFFLVLQFHILYEKRRLKFVTKELFLKIHFVELLNY